MRLPRRPGSERGTDAAYHAELRHFEAVFLQPTDGLDTVHARIFDLFQELPFAGHPIIGAAAVLLDESALEVRHWNNDGIVEDVATGSAAGTIGAYRLRHGLVRDGESFILNQGHFMGRPSVLRVLAEGNAYHVDTVKVGGDVSFVGHGVIEALP